MPSTPVGNTEKSINETPPKFEAGTLQQQLRHTNRHAILATPCCGGGVDSRAQNWNCLLTRVRDEATKQTVASNSSGNEIAWFKTLTTPPSSCVFNISLSGCLIFDHRHTIYLVLPPCFDITQENVRSLATLPRIPHLLKALVTPQRAFQYKTRCWLWSRLVCNYTLYRFTTSHAMWILH